MFRPAPIAPGGTTSSLPDRGLAPELIGITDWLNAQPTTLEKLRGRVVLLEFWTFACSNCQHVTPAVKAWHERYADQGLTVLGIHTPELAFEREPTKVRDAVARAGITYPVALDPDFETWDAYRNRYWPAFYFIDRRGHVRHTHVGEGDDARSEAVLQQLLAEPA